MKRPVPQDRLQREIYSFVDELNLKSECSIAFCALRGILSSHRVESWQERGSSTVRRVESRMHIDWHLVIDLLKAWVWTTSTLLVVFLLRRPLAELVAQIARRARKLSVYEVSERRAVQRAQYGRSQGFDRLPKTSRSA
jgi:hypothetical protein